MFEPQATAIAIRVEPVRAWTVEILQTTVTALVRAGSWAVDTAQQFGSLLSVLMGPAVFSAYVFAVWSLSSNLGWTSTFLYTSGPLSNWLVWLALAILIHVAADVLKRRIRLEK